MNSMIGRLQTDRLSAGSAQAELYPKDIENYLIPFIAEQKQQKIVSLLEESRVLKEKSKHLLECAKRVVEIAIEKDKQAAIDWLGWNERLKKKAVARIDNTCGLLCLKLQLKL